MNAKELLVSRLMEVWDGEQDELLELVRVVSRIRERANTPAVSLPDPIKPDVEVLLHTSLVRDELFTWMDEVGKERGYSALRVDTWTIADHPAPDGSTFTLYACTLVYENRD